MGDSESHIANNSAEYFRAFVSYSHADAAAAQKLHRKIETYRLPKSLRLAGIDKPSDGRLGKIFRDREDLPAAQDLSEAVKQALAVSQALIVLCSPDAQASPWVAREIELFRELHPDRPILAAILRGEPEEAFPEPLRQGREPLAADLRKEGDGWRLGLLKIISGIAEVPLDALVQRDAQRRLRSVMAVTGGALAALLVMIGMTIFAFQQRSEAQHQQAEAEGMVEYMLTDLRNGLISVGRGDIMIGVNKRAMTYYQNQRELGSLSGESQERYARVFASMADDDKREGRLEEAEKKYRIALATSRKLVQEEPMNSNRIFSLAYNYNRLGLLMKKKRNYTDAKRYFDRSNNLITQLNPLESRNRDWMDLTYFTYGNLCVELNRNNTGWSTIPKPCKLALAYSQKIVRHWPDDSRAISSLAYQYAWQADMLMDIGQTDEGFALHKKNLSTIEQLVEKEPRNTEWLQQKMQVYVGYAEMLRDHNRKRTALKYARMAILVSTQLIAHDDKNNNWRAWNQRAHDLTRELEK